ncbi:Exocyst complex component EXO70B1 [Senna tora]|uniref:Exocyst complex component EXO70B1 n=1 Tax=Senna tora TaxID=362788 RepID=A0A834WJQ4_9FABA|nr:Exocyst complex component EXO70B1 [Senna tora]
MLIAASPNLFFADIVSALSSPPCSFGNRRSKAEITTPKVSHMSSNLNSFSAERFVIATPSAKLRSYSRNEESCSGTSPHLVLPSHSSYLAIISSVRSKNLSTQSGISFTSASCCCKLTIHESMFVETFSRVGGEHLRTSSTLSLASPSVATSALVSSSGLASLQDLGSDNGERGVSLVLCCSSFSEFSTCVFSIFVDNFGAYCAPLTNGFDFRFGMQTREFILAPNTSAFPSDPDEQEAELEALSGSAANNLKLGG